MHIRESSQQSSELVLGDLALSDPVDDLRLPQVFSAHLHLLFLRVLFIHLKLLLDALLIHP
jgi:hypothetical protein